MKNRKVFTLLLTGMLTLSMGSTVYASGTDAAIAEAQAEKQAAEEGLAQVQSSIGTLESKKQELESYLADLNAQYEDLTNSISELSIQAAEKEDELNKVKKELKKAKKASADQYESMSFESHICMKMPELPHWRHCFLPKALQNSSIARRMRSRFLHTTETCWINM